MTFFIKILPKKGNSVDLEKEFMCEDFDRMNNENKIILKKIKGYSNVDEWKGDIIGWWLS